MMKRFSAILAAGLVTLACLGCNDPNTMETTLQALERGKAQGQLILTSDGRVSVDQRISFGLGAGKAALSFSGNIDFNDPVNRPEAKEVEVADTKAGE